MLPAPTMAVVLLHLSRRKQVQPDIFDAANLELGLGEQSRPFKLLPGSMGAKSASKLFYSTASKRVLKDVHREAMPECISGDLMLARGGARTGAAQRIVPVGLYLAG
jgi:hypothetical protein